MKEFRQRVFRGAKIDDLKTEIQAMIELLEENDHLDDYKEGLLWSLRYVEKRFDQLFYESK